MDNSFKKEAGKGGGRQKEKFAESIHLSGIFTFARRKRVDGRNEGKIRNARLTLFSSLEFTRFFPCSISFYLCVCRRMLRRYSKRLERTSARASSSCSKKIHDFNKTRHEISREIFFLTSPPRNFCELIKLMEFQRQKSD